MAATPASPVPSSSPGYFHLDDADRAFVAERRGGHMRLGCAVQLGTVRFLGTFLEDPADVRLAPFASSPTRSAIVADGLMAEYAASRWRMAVTPAEIRERYGYRAFTDPFVRFRLNRWLYALCWTGTDRPSVLFDRATAWLVADKVLLPGRPRWSATSLACASAPRSGSGDTLLAGITPEQRERLDALLSRRDGARQSPLDRLRDGPYLRSAGRTGPRRRSAGRGAAAGSGPARHRHGCRRAG